jgi:hypothetical protein|nr:MAG: hypothetical protein [Bacteriophage sp.]
MTRTEFEVFKNENLLKRFYWSYSIAERIFLTKKGYKYLFRCTHYKTGKDFWVFDKTDDLMKDVKIWKDEHKKKVSEAVE